MEKKKKDFKQTGKQIHLGDEPELPLMKTVVLEFCFCCFNIPSELYYLMFSFVFISFRFSSLLVLSARIMPS
jgi:hypothetical protein